MSITTPCIQPIHDWRMRREHVADVLAARRRRQPDQPVHERFGADRHVVRGDQDEDERAEDAGHVQPDRRERPDQPVGLVGVALDEALDLVADLAGALAGHVGVHLLEVLDDRRHVVHELVRLVHERRDQEVDDEHERADAGEQRQRARRRARDPVALEPLRGGRQRDRDDDRSPGSPAAASRAGGRAARRGAARRRAARSGTRSARTRSAARRSSRASYGTPPERQTGAVLAPVRCFSC